MRRALPLLLTLAPSLALAGAWVRPPGGVYLRLGPSVFVGEPTPGGLTDAPPATFTGAALDGYLEVGLGAGLELDLSARWVDHRHDLDDGGTRENAGAGDIEALLKWRLLDSSHGHVFALTAGARVAPYDTPTFEDEAVGEPPRGPGGADVLTGASWGVGLEVFPGWLTVDALHRLRLNSPSAGLSLRAELGWRPFAAVALAATADLQPAYGRRIDGPEDAPLPVPTQGGVGGKLLVALGAGLGLGLDATWQPDALNDGPGYRLGAGVTYERD